ncbi:RagB/SusD family nutrient uptake outer membrane protein [Pedobacter frigiditerrae]|uniref:RagB/SusD family nutrient uptake outer membrane protein n=1 Tax=Pedobacter frigiditerrae TaxID=2530452 RepID=A0A4R0MT89_9SPHI|nr:RagB/SusD family nutrient uptake outer membrane protein [Pedobacter frigiditerrae]TCC90013.1 RagB/SusD family nutrient uptake outer membrane protein [Pedobacter frigiditerrae]
MKNNIINKLVLLVALSMILLSCQKDIFDKRDLSGLDPAIWDTESATNLYINKTYDLVMPNWPVAGALHNTSDESNGATTALLYGQLTEASVPDIASNNTGSGNNQYFTIRRINLAIQGIEASTLAADVKAKLKGQMYFFRAYMYFNLIKLYGGVPLVLKSQDINTDVLDVPRAKTSECVKQIVADLDSCYGLPYTWPVNSDGGRISRMAALALKGKVLMYWASPQFNPTNDLTRWETAYTACKDAYDKGLANGYDLIANYANIFIDESASNKERIMWRTYDAITTNPGRGTNIENALRPFSESSAGGGSYQPTWNLVQAYTLKDGVPITNAASSSFTYDQSVFYVNRDPRLEASIAYNGNVWPLSGKSGRRQWNYVGVTEDVSKQTSTGFYIKRISNPSITAVGAAYNSNTGGGSGMDWIELRFAEVLLNLAESANATGRMAEAKTLLIKLRTRAGIVAGTKNYGLDLATTTEQLATVILNERQVEFAMEGKRYDDLRRTRTFHLLTGTVRQGYRWAPKSPNTVATLEALVPATTIKVRDNIDVTNATQVNSYFTPSIISLDTAQPISFPTNYYFYPLPAGFLTSSVKIEQTLGWSGGTFDPLL